MGVMGKCLVISVFFPLKVHIPHFFFIFAVPNRRAIIVINIALADYSECP